MDTLAAIGLIANIISFIEVGTKVFNKARAIYNSASNSTEEIQSQELVTSEMEGFSQKLLPPRTTILSQDERDLHDLATECKKLAGDITSLLRVNNQLAYFQLGYLRLSRSVTSPISVYKASVATNSKGSLLDGPVKALLALLRVLGHAARICKKPRLFKFFRTYYVS